MPDGYKGLVLSFFLSLAVREQQQPTVNGMEG